MARVCLDVTPPASTSPAAPEPARVDPTPSAPAPALPGRRPAPRSPALTNALIGEGWLRSPDSWADRCAENLGRVRPWWGRRAPDSSLATPLLAEDSGGDIALELDPDGSIAEADLLSEVQGEWVCNSSDFYEGSVIEISRHGWRPRKPRMRGDRHAWDVHPGHIELIEKGADGTRCTFRLVPSLQGKELKVIDSQRSERSWTLRRAGQFERKSFIVATQAFKKRVEDLLHDSASPADLAQPDVHGDSGFWKSLATSERFNCATLAVIFLNALWLAVDTDCNKAAFLSEAPLIFQAVDNLFCGLFCFEILVRFMASRARSFLRDPYFCFDALLVATMAWDTWVVVLLHECFGLGKATGRWRETSVLRILRAARVTRAARLVRVVRAIPELLVMLKGLGRAIRSVTCTLGLLSVIIYIFALIFTTTLGHSTSGDPGIEDVFVAFQTVPWSMHTLLMQVVCGFDSPFITSLLIVGFEYYVLFLLYMLLASLTVLNLLIGVLCDVVSTTTAEEKERQYADALNARTSAMIELLDEDRNGRLNEHEFMELMRKPEVLHQLEELGIDVVNFMDFIRFVFLDTDELLLHEFQELIKQFQGGKPATMKDIVDVNKFITMELRSLERRLVSSLDRRVESGAARSSDPRTSASC